MQFRSQGDPVLDVSNPAGSSEQTRRRLIDSMQDLNRIQLGNLGDPEIATQIDNYELAYRMQTSVPELMDISKEPKDVLDLYGRNPARPRSRTIACWPAGSLNAASVSSSSYHRDWDHHGNLPDGFAARQRTDQASAALVMDLKERGLLDDTLVIWGGEFGRTTYSQGNHRPALAATIIPGASAFGWPAAASSRASLMARQTTSAITSSKTASTFTISTLPCCIVWVSITKN